MNANGTKQYEAQEMKNISEFRYLTDNNEE